MEKIIGIIGQIPMELHSDFRWALKLKGETAKDVIAKLVHEYVRMVKAEVSRASIGAR